MYKLKYEWIIKVGHGNNNIMIMIMEVEVALNAGKFQVQWINILNKSVSTSSFLVSSAVGTWRYKFGLNPA